MKKRVAQIIMLMSTTMTMTRLTMMMTIMNANILTTTTTMTRFMITIMNARIMTTVKIMLSAAELQDGI